MFAKGYKIASPAAALIIVCFFLPWVMVSCSGQQLAEFSGWELATGPEINTGFGVERADATPTAFLIPLFAIAILVLAWRSSQKQHLSGVDRYGLIVLGALPLILMWIQFLGAQSEAASQGFRMESRIGWWGTVIGLLGIAAGGAINWKGGTLDWPKSGAPLLEKSGASVAPVNERMLSPPSGRVPDLDIESGLLGALVVTGGNLKGQRFTIYQNNVLIGRTSESDVRIQDPAISRRHARLRYARGQWFIQDQDSASGVYVNEARVSATRLQTGDILRLGETKMRFQAQQSTE